MKHVSILVNRYIPADGNNGWYGKVENNLLSARKAAHRYNTAQAAEGRLVCARPCYVDINGDVIWMDTLKRVQMPDDSTMNINTPPKAVAK